MSAAKPLIVPVIFIDRQFVVGVQADRGRWALPALDLPAKHSINTVLKKFMKDNFNLNLPDLVDEDKVRVFTVYASVDKEGNRVYQHTYVINLTSAELANSESPDDFGMLPMNQVSEAPVDLLTRNHLQIIMDCFQVGN